MRTNILLLYNHVWTNNDDPEGHPFFLALSCWKSFLCHAKAPYRQQNLSLTLLQNKYIIDRRLAIIIDGFYVGQ